MDIGDSVNGFANYMLDKTMFSRILSNVVGITFLIIVCIALILMFNYGDEIKEDRRRNARTLVYMFIAVFVLILIHYQSVMRKSRMYIQEATESNTLNGIEKIRNKADQITPFDNQPTATIVPDITEQQYY